MKTFMTLVQWPRSQVCQACKHGYLLLDMGAGDIACLKTAWPNIEGECDHCEEKIQEPINTDELGDES